MSYEKKIEGTFDELTYSMEFAACKQFALMLSRYRNEPPGIREAIDLMVAIISDQEANEHECMLAVHTLMEGLFPKDPVDL
jgi:hypothetical protein